MNQLFVNNVGDLGELQRASYYRFLYQGISEELKIFKNPLYPVKLYYPTRPLKRRFLNFVYLYTDKVKFKGPYHNIEEVLNKDLTYSIYFYVPSFYTYQYEFNTDMIKKENYFMLKEQKKLKNDFKALKKYNQNHLKSLEELIKKKFQKEVDSLIDKIKKDNKLYPLITKNIHYKLVNNAFYSLMLTLLDKELNKELKKKLDIKVYKKKRKKKETPITNKKKLKNLRKVFLLKISLLKTFQSFSTTKQGKKNILKTLKEIERKTSHIIKNQILNHLKLSVKEVIDGILNTFLQRHLQIGIKIYKYYRRMLLKKEESEKNIELALNIKGKRNKIKKTLTKNFLFLLNDCLNSLKEKISIQKTIEVNLKQDFQSSLKIFIGLDEGEEFAKLNIENIQNSKDYLRLKRKNEIYTQELIQLLEKRNRLLILKEKLDNKIILLQEDKKKKKKLIEKLTEKLKDIIQLEKKEISFIQQKEKIFVKRILSFFRKHVKINQEKRRILVNQDILFGEIPLMTEEGSFILNGCEKIVVSQIIRSPGVYFEKKFDTRNKAIYTATIISNKGLWTRVIYDEYPYVYQVKIGERLVEVKVDTGNKKKEKKWEVEPIMRSKVDYYERIYIRFNDYNKMESLEYDVEKEEETDKDYLYLFYLINCFGFTYRDMFDNLKYPLIFFKHLFDRIHKEITETDQFEFHEKNEYKLFNLQSGCLSIGEIGRYKINKQLGLNLPKEVTYLTAHDFIEIINALIELKYYDRRSDDIDHIKNKQVRSIGELLQNQIRMAFLKINRNFNDPAKNSQLLESSFEFDTSEIKDENYIHKNELIIDSRVVTNTIKEFFMTSELSQFMDQINPLAELTHKRRISVFGPNGMKRDHISNVIRDIHPSQYGRLCPVETPEGQNAGLINSIAMYGRVSELGWIESPYFLIKENCVLSNKTPIFLNPEQESHTKIAFCDTSITPFRELTNEYLSAKEDYIFSLEKSKNVLFFTTSPLQLISLATSLIPFIEHDDANRALMGSNMQRQAVPLFLSQKPIVGTGLEFVVPLDSQMVIKSYNEGKVAYSSSSIIKIIDTNNQSISYYLRKYKSSNQDTCINQRPVVWTGEKIFSGQIIADGASTNDGELALGKNLTIAYMPWEGYNYEDAIIISERLLIDDCLTSIHIEEYETTINHSVDPEESERLTKDLPHLTRYVRRHLSKKGIVQIGSYVKEYDVLVGKLVPTELIISPEYALYLAIKGQDAKKQRPSRDVSLRVPEGNQGRVIDIRILSTYVADPVEEYFSTYSEVIKISVAQIRKIQIGDKLAGRHGNKGIISRILSRQDMPYLPDGTPIDIIFNPLGVPSRMNVGQVFEGLLGLAGEYLGKRYKVSAFDEIYGKEASRILVNQKLKEASIKKELNWLFNPLFPGKILLRDGRTGEYFDNPITVGKSYILKLIHLVEDKIHARSTGPYSMITEQPLGGKALNGGQRFGEMEVWALEAHGCSHILQELLMVKSDDIDARNDIYQAIVTRRYDYIIGNPRPTISEAFLVLIRELNALGLDFALQQISYYPEPQTVERDLFKDMEQRIKLREMLNRTKVDKLIALDKISAKENEAFSKILEAEYDKIFKNVKNILKENRKHFKDRIKE